MLAASPSSSTKSHDEESDGTDYLALEVELQDLMDRMATFEAGQAHIIEVQRSILKNQEEIFGRMARLENIFNMRTPSHNRSHPLQIPPPPKHAPPTLDSSLDASYDSRGGPITPWDNPPPPPPPAHAASYLPSTPRRSPPLCLDGNDYLGLDSSWDESLSNSCPPTHRQNNFGGSSAGGELEFGVRAPPPGMLPPSRNPLCPLQLNTPVTSGATINQGTTAPQNKKTAANKLPSSTINKGQLLQATSVIQKYPGLVYESKIGTLATKLAKEAFFGDNVLVQCTVSGGRDYPGLPADELMQLKHALYMQFPDDWNSPQEFEPLWTKCKAAIGQAYKRLRAHAKH